MWDDPIVCKLAIQSLGDNLQNYAALSYTCRFFKFHRLFGLVKNLIFEVSWAISKQHFLLDLHSKIPDWTNASTLLGNDPVDATQIEREGHHYIKVNHDRYFKISINLLHALGHLRHPTEPKMIWIDAICINQRDILERNHQVDIMKEIYRGANPVISWLGPSYHHSPSVIALVNQVHPIDNSSRKREMILLALRYSKFNFLQAYTSILKRAYWYRTWIIQEVFSATRLFIQCGSDIVLWQALVSFQQFLTAECFDEVWDPDARRWVPPMDGNHRWVRFGYITRTQLAEVVSDADRFTNLAVLRDLRKVSPNDEEEERLRRQRTLDRLLFDNWDAIATNPLDKVFAIFRLASDGDQYGIQVDYDSDVNAVNRLYTNIIKRFIHMYGNLSIILPRRTQNPDHRLPSWCPDWSITTPASRMGNWQDAYPFQVSSNSWDYFASGYQLPAQVWYNNNNTGQSMYVNGFRLDLIHHESNDEPDYYIEETIPRRRSNNFIRTLLCFFPSDPETQTIRRQATDFEKWYAMHRRELHAGFSRETTVTQSIPLGNEAFLDYCTKKHEEFFWVLHRATHLFTDEQPKASRTANTRHLLRRWRRNCNIPSGYAARRRSNVMGGGLKEVVREMGEVKINEIYTCFFTTKNGFMGLGPEGLEERDLVVILRGCGFPVVLRREGPSAFRIIGACYLAGFMFGEFWSGGWGERVREETFEIC